MGVTTRQGLTGDKRTYASFDEDDEEQDVKPIILSSGDEAGDDSDSDDSSSSNSDDENGTGDEQGIVGDSEHDENDEPYPPCPAFDQSFSVVAHDLISISKAAVDIIDASSCNSSRVQSCRASADALAVVPQAKRETVALLGNTGAGKSSLLNSLLGLPNLAKAMDSGQSCTYVGTQYEGPFAGQTKPLAAKVEYFGIDQIESLLRRLVKDYCTWHFNRPQDCNPDEEQELHRLSIAAFNTLRSLFCNRDEFESPRAAADYLEQSYEDEDADAAATMVEWCEELLEEKEADEDDHIEYLDADTQHDLLAQLNPLVFSNSRYEEPALWPLVRKVRVGIENCRVPKYTTILDLPGLDDTNKVRVDASMEMLRDCDTIWIVTKIGRAITDTSVDGLLMRLGKDYDIVVVCTGIDEHLDDTLAAHLRSEGQSIGNHDELLERERHLRRLVKRLPRKIETRTAKLEGRAKTRSTKKRRALSAKTRTKLQNEVHGYTQELATSQKELGKVAGARFELMVDARNAYTIRRLHDEKAGHLATGKTLDIFCVSNAHYAALKGAKVVNGPRLKVKETGIPALRAFILKNAAPLHLQALEDLINHKYTVFMQGLAMWTKSFSVDGSLELLRAIKVSINQAEKPIEKYLDKIKEVNNTSLVAPIIEAQDEMSEAALSEVEKKKAWHWSTMRAFIRRDGNHTTRVAPKQSWNEQFQAKATELTIDNWDVFLTQQKDLSRDLKIGLLEILSEINKTITAHPASMVLPMDKIDDILKAQVEGINQACRDFQKGQRKELRNIKLDLTQDRHSSYFTKAMDAAYTACKEDAGKGIKNRSLQTFEKHLKMPGTDSPFHQMAMSLSTALEEDSKARMKTLSSEAEEILDEIYGQFDDMVDQKIDDDAEKELRKELRKFVEVAEGKFEKAKADLAGIKEKYAE